MAPRLLLSLLLALASSNSVAADEDDPSSGTGCQPLLAALCPSYYSKYGVNNTGECLACVKAQWDHLKVNCTRKRADKKCTDGHAPAPAPPALPLPPVPPAPALPPLRPTPGAPRPHIMLFVVDDMGWAALGKRNPGNVLTPNLASPLRNLPPVMWRH